MTDEKTVTIDLVKGNSCGEGLYINDTRVAGTKPMPGGQVVKSWKVPVKRLLDVLKGLSK